MMQSTVDFLDSIRPDQFADDAERFAAKEAARRLLTRLETPFEHGWKLAFETPVLVAALQVVEDLGIWEKWAAAEKEAPGKPRTLDDLLAWGKEKAEPNLIRRFLKHISALYLLEETDVDTWKATPFSLHLGDKATHGDMILKCGLDHTIPCGTNMPRFLAKYHYKEPLDLPALDNYRDLFGKEFFEINKEDPAKGGSFIGLMTALRNHKMTWTSVYDTTRLLNGADLAKSPLFVDVGGAHGLDAHALVTKHPELPAETKVIVQDLAPVVSEHAHEKLDPRIERMAHDFFEPQPVKGARAYFLHAVPHDWPDKDCLRIFGEISKAMERGYSRLLIYEVVLPAKGATSMMTTLDLELMNCVSGQERTEEHWRRLLKEAGLEVVGISRHLRAVESVMEVVLEGDKVE